MVNTMIINNAIR